MPGVKHQEQVDSCPRPLKFPLAGRWRQVTCLELPGAGPGRQPRVANRVTKFGIYSAVSRILAMCGVEGGSGHALSS
jgi:hypothetical protein